MHTSTWHFWKVSRYWCSFVRTLRLKRFLLRNWGCYRGSWKSMKKPCWAVLRSWTCCNRNWLPPNRETRYCLRSFWLGLRVFISTLVCQAVGIKSCYKSSENWCHLFILPAHSLCLTSGDTMMSKTDAIPSLMKLYILHLLLLLFSFVILG